MWLASTTVEDHAMTLTSTPSNHQTPLFSSLFQPSLNTPWPEAIARYSPPLSGDCVAGTLSAGTLPDAHRFDWEKRKWL